MVDRKIVLKWKWGTTYDTTFELFKSSVDVLRIKSINELDSSSKQNRNIILHTFLTNYCKYSHQFERINRVLFMQQFRTDPYYCIRPQNEWVIILLLSYFLLLNFAPLMPILLIHTILLPISVWQLLSSSLTSLPNNIKQSVQ